MTFRLHGTLPADVVARLAADTAKLPSWEKHEQFDDRLDTERGADFLRQPAIATMVVRALRHFDGTRYHLHAWCVMPNHVHVVFTAQDDLASILHSWKSYTANRANKLLGRSGEFWQREYYDHLVRDEADFARCVEYTLNNPVKAGLCQTPEEWPWSGVGRLDAGGGAECRQDAGATHGVEFEVFEPTTDKDVPAGTVARARATCLACGAVLPPERVRAQLAARRGGADAIFDDKGRRTGGARLLAVVTLRPGEQGRHYRLPTARDYEAVRRAQARLAGVLEEGKRSVAPASSRHNAGKTHSAGRMPALRPRPSSSSGSLPVAYKDVQLDCGYRLDVLVANSVVVEIKAVESILPIHEAQLLRLHETGAMEARSAHQFQRTGPQGRHSSEDSLNTLCPLCLCGEREARDVGTPTSRRADLRTPTRKRR